MKVTGRDEREIITDIFEHDAAVNSRHQDVRRAARPGEEMFGVTV